MKSEKKLEQAIRLCNDVQNIGEAQLILRMSMIKDYLHEFLVDNAQVTRCKRNLYEVLDKDDQLRHIMCGVYHDETGYAVATDGHIIVASKAEYNEANKGQVIDMYGKEIEGRYPNWKSVIPKETWRDYHCSDEIQLPSMDELAALSKELKAYKREMNALGYDKAYKQCAVILAGKYAFRLDLLIKMRAWTDRANLWFSGDKLNSLMYDTDELKVLMLNYNLGDVQLPEDGCKAVMFTQYLSHPIENVRLK